MQEQYIIQTRNLEFSFASRKIINSVDLRVPPKSIYCFLGPNGSGKTTTIRILLSLLKLNNPAVELFGMDIRKKRLDVARRTGSLIEQPSVYLHLTAYQNLLVAAKTHNCDRQLIDDALGLTGIVHAKHQAVRTYSLGMKQRLGIALALLHDPELLVLDEPTNGLDPQGIVDIRELLIKLNQAGKTIFISSHLLSEVEKIATHFGILHKGHLIFQGTKQALEQRRSATTMFELKTNNIESTISALDGQYAIVKDASDRLFIKHLNLDDVPALLKKVINNDIGIFKAAFVDNSLEDLFIEMTKP